MCTNELNTNLIHAKQDTSYRLKGTVLAHEKYQRILFTNKARFDQNLRGFIDAFG